MYRCQFVPRSRYNVGVTDDLRYPIGEFSPVPESAAINAAALADLEQLPAQLREATANLSN